MNFKQYLILLRPANLVTAIADSLAGMAIVSFPWEKEAMFLLLASVCLYGGGVVLNDFFDEELDSKERPERPIPSGKVSSLHAFLLGTALLVLGVFFSCLYSEISLVISICIVFLILLYNRFAKHSIIFGPLVMGLCRGFNLILGMTMIKTIPSFGMSLAILPVVYIAAITLISQNEVSGGGKSKFLYAFFLYALVLFSQTFLSYHNHNVAITIPFIVLHSIFLFPPLWQAFQNPSPKRIGNAVKMGVITLIILNASFAAAFGMMPLAFLILSLLPISFSISKYFAVT
ncbi:polyprenyltransferase [Leptospira biflexa]|jgi:4-hydroxybenzoate polyprenyltransferase|uniref:UbiA-like protein EboC n=1 Tax=Leptospira biflexa TaxID=172 RepID=UPI00109106B0|nr:UbiA-like protein EboC [Leptospira biflexa]TGM57505.1 polyprenyltransferase [Leptospira biflexa]